MKNKIKLHTLCMCMATLCLLCLPVFGRVLSYTEMTSIKGSACCDGTTTHYDCYDSDGAGSGHVTDTCHKCNDALKPADPASCPGVGTWYSGYTYSTCISGGSGNCSSSIDVDCYKSCTCKEDIVGGSVPLDNKKCDGPYGGCNTNDSLYKCRPCMKDTCDATWQQKPDRLCN